MRLSKEQVKEHLYNLKNYYNAKTKSILPSK
jgi:hypothetical protein